MAAASSPGSRLEAKSASVLGQLSQANREWSEAYHQLKDNKTKDWLALETELAERSARLAASQSDLASVLSAVGFPSAEALHAHLARRPLPPGGLPAMQQALDRTHLVASAMCVLNADAGRWWEERDAVGDALEDERDRRRLVEAELEALQSKNTPANGRPPTPTKARSPARARPLTPSRTPNLPPTTAPPPGPPASPAVLGAQVRALKDALKKQKDKHRTEKRHWRLFSERLVKAYHEGRLDLSGRPPSTAAAGAAGPPMTIALNGLARDAGRTFASSATPALSHLLTATSDRPTSSKPSVARPPPAQAAPLPSAKPALPNPVALPSTRPKEAVGARATAPEPSSTARAPAVTKSPAPPSPSKSPPRAQPAPPPPPPPPPHVLQLSQTQSQSQQTDGTLLSGEDGHLQAAPALVDAAAPVIVARPRILAPASDPSSSSSLTPLTPSLPSPAADLGADVVESSVAEEAPSRRLLPPGGPASATRGLRELDVKLAAAAQKEPQTAQRTTPSTAFPLPAPSLAGRPPTHARPAPQQANKSSSTAVHLTNPRPASRAAPSTSVDEDVFRAPATLRRSPPPALKKRRLNENLERLDPPPSTAFAPRPSAPAVAAAGAPRPSALNQTPRNNGPSAARPAAPAYLPTPDTGARPSVKPRPAPAADSAASSNKSSAKKPTARGGAAATPVGAQAQPLRWLGKHIFSERVRDGETTPLSSSSGGSGSRKRKLGPLDDVDIDTPIRDGGVRPLDLGLSRPSPAAALAKGKGRASEAPTAAAPPALQQPPSVKQEPVSQKQARLAPLRVNVPNKDLPMTVPDSPDRDAPPAPWERTVSQEEAEDARFRAIAGPTKGMTTEERRQFNRSVRDLHGDELRAVFAKYKGRGRYAPELEADRTINQDFEIVPDRNQGCNYAFDDVVRNRDERRQLHGTDCPCCKGYYEAVGVLQPLPSGPVWRRPPPSPERPGETEEQRTRRKREAEIQQHRQDISRHREDHPVPATPPEYWETGMYDDDQIEHINREAQKIQQEKRRRLEAEAAKDNGRYRRRE